MSSRRLFCALALAAGAAVVGARPAVSVAGPSSPSAALETGGAPLEIVSQSVQIDSAQGSATFDLQFNHKPDFYSIDSFGRPADSFQYEVNPEWSGNKRDLQLGFGQFRDVIRGDEIHTSAKLLIRDASTPAHPDPNAGGWGPVVASVPFQVNGEQFTFNLPLHDLRASKAAFSYDVFTTSFGATVSEFQGTAQAGAASQSVPLPPAAWAGMITLGGLALVRGTRRLCRGGEAR